MAGGWAKDGSVQDQIDASVEDAVKRVRDHIEHGEGLSECEDCGEVIPAARRKAVAGVRRCVNCQETVDARRQQTSPINRRGSKDSQLR